MVTPVELPASSGELVLGCEDWCEVMVRSGGGETRLGADTREVVLDRLRGMLLAEELDGSAGSVGDVPVSWVASFSEHHGSLYAGDAPDGRHVFAQDESGTVVAEFVLGEADKAEWLRRLDRMLLG